MFGTNVDISHLVLLEVRISDQYVNILSILRGDAVNNQYQYLQGRESIFPDCLTLSVAPAGGAARHIASIFFSSKSHTLTVSLVVCSSARTFFIYKRGMAETSHERLTAYGYPGGCAGTRFLKSVLGPCDKVCALWQLNNLRSVGWGRDGELL